VTPGSSSRLPHILTIVFAVHPVSTCLSTSGAFCLCHMKCLSTQV
jgi:hypothetical protein